MISHIFQQVHQDLEDQNINSLAAKGIQASLLIFGELDIVLWDGVFGGPVRLEEVAQMIHERL